MNINRHNYEEFLLLYIDGELAIEQQKEVEFFIEQHIDIKQEYNDLLNTKLQADDICFGDISTLLKDEKASINLSNYQEHFLLFVDNELSKENKQGIETFVLQHPALQNEFTTLQQTKLPIETIECPSKEELYKKERKQIVFYLQQLAVAAVFIGFGVFVYSLFGTNKNPETIVAVPKNSEINTNATTNVQQQSTANILTKKEVAKTNNIAIGTTKKIAAEPAKIMVNNVKDNDKKNFGNFVTNNAPATLVKQENILQNNNGVPNNSIANNSTHETQNKQIAIIETPNIQQPTLNNTAVGVIYKTLDADDDNTTQKKPSKLKNFLKKAAKMITPNETSNDEAKKLFAVTL